MFAYHATGLISALLSTIASVGLATQAHLLWRRKRMGEPGRRSVTAGLSINRFVTSFVMFLALYTYGAVLSPFNHYLVWPRVAGMILSLTILCQINADRRSGTSRAAFQACVLLAAAANLFIWSYRPIQDLSPSLFPAIVVGVCCIYLQGGAMQIRLVCRQRSTGGLSRQMHVLFVCKDISLITFAMVMGTRIGWPIVMLCAVGLTVNLGTLLCFHWVQRSQRHAAPSAELAGQNPG